MVRNGENAPTTASKERVSQQTLELDIFYIEKKNLQFLIGMGSCSGNHCVMGKLDGRRARSPDVGDPARAINVDRANFLCKSFIIVKDSDVRQVASTFAERYHNHPGAFSLQD